ncbi:MAG: hypothetical protein K6G85_07435 [Eubacterium sp.]|nr:hypothetical protein [Eubacterium sp.]
MLSKRVKCEGCIHLRYDTEISYPICDAFPDGIPGEIFAGFIDHDEPYEGDNGIRYEEA